MKPSNVSELLFNTLSYRAERQKVISSNIANINTPDYKTKDLSFESQLQEKNKQKDLQLVTTNQNHIKSKENNDKNSKMEVYEVENLQDLSFSIKQYIEVIEKLTGNYRSKVMTLKDYINELSFEDRQAFLITAMEVGKELPDLKNQQVESFFNQLEARVEKLLPQDWSVEMDVERLGKKWNIPFRLFNEQNALWIALEFNNLGYNSITIGVVRKKQEINIASVISDESIQKKLAPFKARYKKFPKSAWWLTYEYIKIDLWTEILKHGEEQMLQELETRFKQLIEDFAPICDLTREVSD